MAELAGLIISGVGLIALANTVTDCLDQVERARSLGTNYDHYALQLDLARLAYGRWLRTVRIVEPGAQPSSAHSLPIASESEIKAVRQLLGAIEQAFKEAQAKGTRYEANSSSNAHDLGTVANLQPEELSGLGNRVRELSAERQKHVKLLDKVRWVVRDSKTMQTLAERVSQNVKSLVELFPANIGQAQQELAAADVAEIAPSADERTLTMLQVAAPDPAMRSMAAEALKGSRVYEQNKIAGKARALYGDQVAAGQHATSTTKYHYLANSATDESKAVYGDQYGMGNFLDD